MIWIVAEGSGRWTDSLFPQRDQQPEEITGKTIHVFDYREVER
jgi:hypothetical protein